ncbi:MAG TPA: BatA domain-containing protein, partial [Longimicrobiales bacterium]|nr:BatA domain-containing protein [Longimicrobiales bacterium]
MPVAFLAPVFLAGLAALAIPVLIHLSSRPRKRVVEFPSLMFLEQVEYQDASKRRLRHILLFALRCLALILLASAFARPFLDRTDGPATAPDGGREVVVLLDRSESMAAGERMARAREAVASVADGLTRGDRATLVVFDHGAAAVNRATDQAAALRAAADTVIPGAAGTRYGPALRLAESILSGSPLPRRELVLVTDFQRTGWDPEAAARMPAGTAIRTLAVGEALANTFVADVRFGRERFSGRERVRVGATVAHRPESEGGGSAAGTVDLPVELVLDGRTMATRTASVRPGGAATVEFDPVTLPDRAVRGTVRAGTDGLPGDNAFHFVLNAGRSLRILVVEPRSGAGSTSGSGAPYLTRALGVSPDHDVMTLTADRLAGTALAGFDVVLINGSDPDGAGRLEDFAAAGGGVIMVLGPRSRAATWAGTRLLPGALQGTRDAETGTALTALRAEHPVFEAFRSGTGGLTAAR